MIEYQSKRIFVGMKLAPFCRWISLSGLTHDKRAREKKKPTQKMPETICKLNESKHTSVFEQQKIASIPCRVCDSVWNTIKRNKLNIISISLWYVYLCVASDANRISDASVWLIITKRVLSAVSISRNVKTKKKQRSPHFNTMRLNSQPHQFVSFWANGFKEFGFMWNLSLWWFKWFVMLTQLIELRNVAELI